MPGIAATPVAQGSQRDFIIKKESTPGVAPSTGSARYLRRTTGMLNLKKEAITSNEKRADFQVTDSRHGSRRVEGTISQELTNGGSTEFWEMLLMRDFAAVASIAAASGDGAFVAASGVISRIADSFAAVGLRVGMVIRLTGVGTNAANRNWIVTAMAADGLSFTVAPVDGGAALADFTSDTSGSIVMPGKRTFIPTSGHLQTWATIEEYLRSLDVSKVNTGLRVSSLALRVGVNGIVTLDWGLIGLDQTELITGDAPYFVSPTAPGTGRAFSSTAGLCYRNGAVEAVATGLNLDLSNGAQTMPVVFSQTSPDIPLGRALTARGQTTAAVKDRSYNTLFRNETEYRQTMVFEAPAAAGTAPEFFAIDLGRIKVNAQDEDDPDGPIIQTIAIEALLAAAATGVDATTIAVQDSSL